MADDTPHETSTDDRHLSRRGTLVAAGGLGAGLTGAYAGSRRLLEGRSNDEPGPDREALGDPPERREDFVWLGAGLWRDEGLRRNLFAFARRHDLAVVLVKGHSGDRPLAEGLRPVMEAAAEFGLELWLNVGLLTDIHAEQFVTDATARERHLEHLSEVARIHGDLFDSGRIILWQEAPVMGDWAHGGEWNEAAVDNLLEHGPEIFDAQKRVVEEVNDSLEVGPFVHFPYLVDSKRPEVFAELARGFRDRGVDPDFGFVDFYRGWYEKDVGPERANEAVTSLITNARAALENAPVYYLGQSHTINPNHTPSKQALRMNLRASLEAGAAGLGWYVRNRYVPTETGFDPFVPNVPGADPEGDSITTLTIARDRFQYPWLATLESGDGFAADEAFDLWLLADEDGFGFHDHRLSVRTADGEWEYVGDVGGSADGDYPDDSPVTDRATVFRGLDRDRLLSGGSLECRLETADGSDGAELAAALAMPCEPDDYVSEREAVEFARGDAPLADVSLGRTSGSVALEPGESRRLELPVDGDGRSLAALRGPDYLALRQRLAAFEARTDVDPSARFDCWLRGEGLADPAALPSIRDADGTERALPEVGIVASSETVALCYGLARHRFLEDGGLELADDAGADASVDEAYAMSYAGRATFRTPARAATLVDEQPGEVETFSLERVNLD